MDAIQTFQLTKKYKDTLAVDALTLSVPHGELFALLGVNGAGKTTTIRMLCGLVRPTSGDALLNGHSILTDLAGVKREIGVSPQETAVAPNLTVKENLDFFAALYGTDDKEYIASIIDGFSLGEVLSQRAKTLSGGWKRRVSIAIGMISKPKVLFLDEPTLGLDILARRELWKIIRSLKGKETIILTTHYLEEAEALCDKVAIMAKGEILAAGTPEELKISAGTENFEDAFVKITEGDL